ncbi:MAG: hypothetical protein ACLP9L_15725 [Thermoguttaceae bacterium]
MIISGTVASAPVQGVTVQDPADQSTPAGFGVVANGMRWTASSGPNFSFAALGVLAATGNLDWSLASYFTLTTTAGTNLTLTFGLTGALTTASYTLGQMIKVRVTGAGTPTITWPATITWCGITATPAASASAPLVVNGAQIDITLVCTGAGSVPTFDGFYLSV